MKILILWYSYNFQFHLTTLNIQWTPDHHILVHQEYSYGARCITNIGLWIWWPPTISFSCELMHTVQTCTEYNIVSQYCFTISINKTLWYTCSDKSSACTQMIEYKHHACFCLISVEIRLGWIFGLTPPPAVASVQISSRAESLPRLVSVIFWRCRFKIIKIFKTITTIFWEFNFFSINKKMLEDCTIYPVTFNEILHVIKPFNSTSKKIGNVNWYTYI